MVFQVTLSIASGADYYWVTRAYAMGITRNLTPSAHKGNKNVCYQLRLYSRHTCSPWTLS